MLVQQQFYTWSFYVSLRDGTDIHKVMKIRIRNQKIKSNGFGKYLLILIRATIRFIMIQSVYWIYSAFCSYFSGFVSCQSGIAYFSTQKQK